MKDRPRILTLGLSGKLVLGYLSLGRKRHASVEVSVVYFVAGDGSFDPAQG